MFKVKGAFVQTQSQTQTVPTDTSDLVKVRVVSVQTEIEEPIKFKVFEEKERNFVVQRAVQI